MKKAKVSLSYNWTCNKEKTEILERAKRALSIATLQAEFWKSEVEFWKKRLEVKEYNISLNYKPEKK